MDETDLPQCNYRVLQNPVVVKTEPLWLEWTVDYESISDNYTPEEVTADELFDRWLERIDTTLPSTPISWHTLPHKKERPSGIRTTAARTS